MNTDNERFLVVINPNESRHQALQRALITAGIRDSKPSLHLYINPQGASSKPTGSSIGTFGNLALQQLTSLVEQHALPYDYEFSWSEDSEAAVVAKARADAASLIIYPLSEVVYSRHKGFATGTWTLLRNSPCPVMLVTPESSMQRKVILAAVNFQSPFPEYTALNDRIVRRARWLADKYDAALYVVNAWQSMEDYPDYEDIRKATDLPFGQILIEEGRPERVVSEAARRVNADLVMIGTRNSRDHDGLFRRNTAEKVLMSLNRDMIVVN